MKQLPSPAAPNRQGTARPDMVASAECFVMQASQSRVSLPASEQGQSRAVHDARVAKKGPLSCMPT